jgi:hypothetical protein
VRKYENISRGHRLFRRKDHHHCRRRERIGRATALIFAREHANIVCADVNEVGAKLRW